MAVQHMISSDFTVGVHGEKGVCVCVWTKNRKYSSSQKLDYNDEVFPTALISCIVAAIAVIGSPSERLC